MPYKNKEDEKQNKQKYYQKNKDAIKIKVRLYASDNKDKIKINKQQYYMTIYREKSLKAKYNINEQDYQKLSLKQNHVCCICRKPENIRDQYGKIKPLSVDHDHETGKIRGLLCNRCNNGLGRFYDSIILLEKALNYLKENT